MTLKHDAGFAKNVFQHLHTQNSLWVLGLCLASHDMVHHRELIDNSEAEEANYHLAASLSILREAAKIVKNLDAKAAFKRRFSRETRDLFAALKKDLKPFQDKSLTRGILKPIRDITFHYDFKLTESCQMSRVNALLAGIRKQHELRVRATRADNSILRYRYTFADEFRSGLVAGYLTEDIVRQVAVAVTNVIAFTDSLMADLSQ